MLILMSIMRVFGGEVGRLEMTGEMRVVVENAFSWKEGLGLGIMKVGMARCGRGLGLLGARMLCCTTFTTS